MLASWRRTRSPATHAGGDEGIVVLDRTPFYAEMGGQIGRPRRDHQGRRRFEVSDVQKNKGGKYMHTAGVTGSINVGDMWSPSIDAERRQAIMRAHSATHLLQQALQTVLGDHVHQAGSSWSRTGCASTSPTFRLTPEELREGRGHRPDAILAGYTIVTREMPIDEAKKPGRDWRCSAKSTASTVRVVNMGDYSIELCGGTHLDNTAKVGPF